MFMSSRSVFSGKQCEFLQQHGNGREPSEVVFLNIASKLEVLQRFSFSQTKIHINGKKKMQDTKTWGRCLFLLWNYTPLVSGRVLECISLTGENMDCRTFRVTLKGKKLIHNPSTSRNIRIIYLQDESKERIKHINSSDHPVYISCMYQSTNGHILMIILSTKLNATLKCRSNIPQNWPQSHLSGPTWCRGFGLGIRVGLHLTYSVGWEGPLPGCQHQCSGFGILELNLHWKPRFLGAGGGILYNLRRNTKHPRCSKDVELCSMRRLMLRQDKMSVSLVTIDKECCGIHEPINITQSRKWNMITMISSGLIYIYI